MSADDFESAAMLAGYFVAHGVWSISEGARFSPLVAHEGPEGRGFQKFVGEDDGRADALRAAEWLASNPTGAERAVMVVDGFAELDGVGHDALIAHVIEFGPLLRSLHIVVPYRPKKSDAGFAIHSPRFGGAENIELSDLAAIGDAFYAGVGAHSAASPIWTANLDESV
jgi:hypothetical protein